MARHALPRGLPVIFTNPAGAPELACYECGAEVSPEAQAEFRQALEKLKRTQAAEG